MGFDQFLIWASSAGVWAVVGWVLPWVANFFGAPWEDIVPPRWRAPLMLLLCEVTPVLAVLLRVAMKYTTPSFPDLIWPALVAGFVAFGEYGIVEKARKSPSTKEFRAFRKRHAASTGFSKELSHEIDRFSWTG